MLFWRIVIFRKGNKEIHTLWLVAKILKCIFTDTIIITVNVHNYSVLVNISLTLKFSLNLEKEWFFFFIRYVPGTRYLYTRIYRIINEHKLTQNQKISPCAPAFFFSVSQHFCSETLWTLGINIHIFPLGVPLSVYLYPRLNHSVVSSGADWYLRCWQRRHLLSCIHHHLAKRSDGLFQNCPQ